MASGSCSSSASRRSRPTSSTAVFSTCDVNFWSFAVATALTLPKQIFLVYFGVLLVQNDKDNKDTTVKTIMISVALFITIVMAVYIYYKMRGIKKTLLEEQAQRKARRNVQPQKWTSPVGSETTLMIPNGGSDRGKAGLEPTTAGRNQLRAIQHEQSCQPSQDGVEDRRSPGGSGKHR